MNACPDLQVSLGPFGIHPRYKISSSHVHPIDELRYTPVQNLNLETKL
jgi:hypothetical protein